MSCVEPRPTVFLDRDGTINFDSEYLSDPAQLQLLPGSGSALGMLRREGFALVVVSNQSAIGRGYCSGDDVIATNTRMEQLLVGADADAILDRIYFCPHSPDADCVCRKPKTGLITGQWSFAADQSWMIGDKAIDIEFGKNLGLPLKQLILVGTGKGARERGEVLTRFGDAPQFVPDLLEAARLIVGGTVR